ncbi:cation-translocating P-type ATPase [Bacteriovorax sp. PP10]|uniref:P-type Zn(2+) transporter n=1 Tax=Bacteriovorax antarcticus TaxID=3088717 RepID=A0ABU5VSA5_9BACT|nr:cation-translocating P-type ATPase [Bacteriovorax sp. PP10]MEA9355797.1 cation-translocating P-type ATPase [Bacteriovorax sp. PP10]
MAHKPHDHSHCCGGGSQAIAEEITSKNISSDDLKTTFKVLNMDCPDEIKAINDALRGEGVLEVKANLMASTVQIIHTQKITKEFLQKRINSTVVKVVENESPGNPNKSRIIKVAISGVALVAGMLVEHFLSNILIGNILFAIAILTGGTLIFPKAFGALKRFSLDMNVLMTFAVIGALIIKQYSEASTVVFLFALSELLESLSVQRARNAIQELFKLTPATTFLLKGNTTEEVSVEAVSVGQIIRVKSGESIPLDGIVVSGTTSVNQASLTGESIPVFKTAGDEVFAGTINEDGSFDIKVGKVFNDTKLSHVIKLVAESQIERAPAQKFVDQFAKIYTPVIFVLAILTYVIPVLSGGDSYEWFYKSLVLLVIACPCALVISTPISIVSALTSLARNGVLIKGGTHLEMLGKIKAIALDKTGTITEGKPEVKSVEKNGSKTVEEILEIATSLENHSTHPFAMAILKYGKSLNVLPSEVTSFKNIPGKGIEAIFKGQTYFLANLKYIQELGLAENLKNNLELIESQADSIVIVGRKNHSDTAGEVYGWIILGDKIRTDAKESLSAIKMTGVREVVILSGDNQKTTEAIGQLVNADNAYGDLLPEDKLKHIETLLKKHKHVAMIGDGVNDAPAMAKSSLGIAMGGIGSGTAIETADITLMADDLKQIPIALKAGRRTLHVIKFNIAFAIVTKLIFLVLTFIGYSNLWMAIIADTGATLIVVLNSLRLLKIKK